MPPESRLAGHSRPHVRLTRAEWVATGLVRRGDEGRTPKRFDASLELDVFGKWGFNGVAPFKPDSSPAPTLIRFSPSTTSV